VMKCNKCGKIIFKILLSSQQFSIQLNNIGGDK